MSTGTNQVTFSPIQSTSCHYNSTATEQKGCPQERINTPFLLSNQCKTKLQASIKPGNRSLATRRPNTQNNHKSQCGILRTTYKLRLQCNEKRLKKLSVWPWTKMKMITLHKQIRWRAFRKNYQGTNSHRIVALEEMPQLIITVICTLSIRMTSSHTSKTLIILASLLLLTSQRPGARPAK